MHEVVHRVPNEGSTIRVVVIEPWGMPLSLEPGHTFKLIARAPAIGEFEIVEESDGVVVYGCLDQRWMSSMGCAPSSVRNAGASRSTRSNREAIP